MTDIDSEIRAMLIAISSSLAEVKEGMRGLHRDLGRIEGTLAHLDAQIDEHRERIAILENQHPHRGVDPKKVAAVGGGGIGLGVLIDWLAHYFTRGGP